MADNETRIDSKTGMRLRFFDGDWVAYGEQIPYWQHRRLLSMNLLGQNKRTNSSEWEMALDCGHSVREICGYWDSPKGMYRDCSPHKKH